MKTWHRQVGGVYFFGSMGEAFAIFNFTNFSKAGYEDVAHRGLVRLIARKVTKWYGGVRGSGREDG